MVSGLGERLVSEILRKDRLRTLEIERAVGFKHRLGGLQLGSGSIDVDHSEYVRRALVGGIVSLVEGAWKVSHGSICSPTAMSRPQETRSD